MALMGRNAGLLLLGLISVAGLESPVRLSDPVDNVRSHAAWALGSIGPRTMDAVAPLMKLTEDVKPQARQMAAASLRHINDKTRK